MNYHLINSPALNKRYEAEANTRVNNNLNQQKDASVMKGCGFHPTNVKNIAALFKKDPEAEAYYGINSPYLHSTDDDIASHGW